MSVKSTESEKIQKAKDKSSGHMVYKSTAVMKDQGYEV